MIKVREDLTGKQFGRLTVIEQIEDYVTPSGNRYNRWLCSCLCDDNKRIPVLGGSLKSGNTQSCGCLERELTILRQKKFNDYEINDDVVIGKSSNTDDLFYVNTCDFEQIKNICWSVYINKSGVKELRGYDQKTQKTWRMHTFLGFGNYDHIDRNELNNRRNNLRLATPQEQVWNRGKSTNKSSNVVGVSWYAREKRWVAELFYNGKKVFRKSFKTEQEAIIARLQAEIKYIKPEFAPNRHLFEQYGIMISNNCEVNI